jgi:hypothetical protein
VNGTEFCKIVENTLGWMPPDRGWKKYIFHSQAVVTKMQSNPTLYTWDNLLAAVELLRREGQPRSPLGVFAHVERAIERKRDVDTDVEKRIWFAMTVENRRGDPDGWGVRFARAMGPFRWELIEEWEAKHGARRSS